MKDIVRGGRVAKVAKKKKNRKVLPETHLGLRLSHTKINAEMHSQTPSLVDSYLLYRDPAMQCHIPLPENKH